MAGDWIKFEHATCNKPEVFQISESLGIDPDAVIGKLLRFWCWCDEQAVTCNDKCNALTVTKTVIDRITFRTGFADAMEKAGWLEYVDGELSVPNFNRHNGKTAKDRSVTNKRVAKNRKCNDECNGDTVTNVTLEPLQKPLPEKRREENTNKRMAKPSMDEISEYGKTLDPPFTKIQSFVSFYESNGWKVGKNPMKDWKAAVRTWHQKDKDSAPPQHRPLFDQPTYAKNGTSQHRPLWD